MMNWHLFVLKIGYFVAVVNSAIIPDTDDVREQGLYTSLDHVTILTAKNFEKKVYGQAHAILVQFYNSYCGHCRAFAPKFKSLASEIDSWKNIIELAVIDCSVEENNEICREFEVMAYPSLRFLHEMYVKGNGNVGERIQPTDSAENLKTALIKKIQTEQTMGRLKMSPHLNIAAYATVDAALTDVPSNILYTFLVFENENSTLGSELSLDLNDYNNIMVKRVYNDSELAKVVGIKNTGLVAVNRSRQHTKLAISETNPTKLSLLKALNGFLKTNDYVFPIRDINFDDIGRQSHDGHIKSQNTDAVYYSDLEKTIKTSLHTEITRHKVVTGEALSVLQDYIGVLIMAFPFKHNNLKDYLKQLHTTLKSKSQWSGSEIYDLVKMLEAANEPVYSSNLDYKGCKGSQPKYRGYTCGLWTLFHTLTVNSYRKDENLGTNVLKVMLGYVKYFFGCTECSEHFQAMAEKNRLLDVQGNDKAILWLWIAHNEVNLRLAGDITEDPEHPKIQFPSTTKCPECRLARGTWNLRAVLQYLMKMYGDGYIETTRNTRSADATSSPFSKLDIGMLSLLYILSFIMLILVIKFFISKHFFRKRRFKHAWAKLQA